MIIVKRISVALLGGFALSYLGQAYNLPQGLVLASGFLFGWFVPSALFPLSNENEQNNSN